MAQTRFKLMDVGFWSDESHWEATVTSTGPNDNDTDTEVIGTVRQNISSFNSKWYLSGKSPRCLLGLNDFSLVQVSNYFPCPTKCVFCSFPIKTSWTFQVKRQEPFFFSESNGRKKKNKTHHSKSSQRPIHWGLNDPLFRLGLSSIHFVASKGLWSTRDLNLGVSKYNDQKHDRFPPNGGI